MASARDERDTKPRRPIPPIPVSKKIIQLLLTALKYRRAMELRRNHGVAGAMWPFRRKPIVDDETAAWHAENFAWLVREFG